MHAPPLARRHLVQGLGGEVRRFDTLQRLTRLVPHGGRHVVMGEHTVAAEEP